MKKIAGHLAMGLFDQFFPYFNERVHELNISLTDTCNAKCNMCDVWKNPKDQHFSKSNARNIVESKEFRSVNHIGLSGGEPYLNPNIIDIVNTLCELKSLNSISITSHGFNFERITRILPKLEKICRSRSIRLICNYSIDGIGEKHDEIRGVPGGFAKTEKAILFSKGLGLEVIAQCTLQNSNLYNALEINDWCITNNVPCQFRVATEIARLKNKKSIQRVQLDKEKYDFLIDFLESDEIKKSAKNFRQQVFYYFLAKQLSTSVRHNPCKYQRRGLAVDGRGNCFQCSIAAEKSFTLTNGSGSMIISRRSRAKFVKKTCSDCIHDQSGFYSPIHLMEYVFKKARIPIYILKAIRVAARLIITFALLPLAVALHKLQLGKAKKDIATIVGCYGGEHVGDGAILGGIISELSDRGYRDIDVFSFRPARTTRWLESMQINKDASYRVKSYTLLNILRSAFNGRELIFGGGPIMDLPYLLSLHGVAVVSHKVFGNRVEFLRVGYGPFRNKAVKWFVDTLLCLGDDISLRTKIDLDTLEASCRQKALQKDDAAFLYLSNKNYSLKTVNVSQLSYDSSSVRKRIGINLRPLWARYASTTQALDDLGKIEQSVIEELVGLIKYFPHYDFELFAMNADTFGMSDFGPLLKLRQLSKSHNIKIMFHEFGVDELSLYLKKFDLIIAMRLHACIFGIANGVKTIGIDYGLGGNSKVYQLFDERGKLEDVYSVGSVSTEALVKRVALLLGPGPINRLEATRRP
jgi:MoaA/NifB/PqqE/SkfB family radical SAM enzyme/polysaccharide pyruvyl transferase WcaK-like protein